MAGTVTVTHGGFRDGLQKTSFAWLSDGSGNATVTTNQLSGTIEGVTFKPNTASGDQPDDNYDVSLKNEDAVDVLSSKGANLSDTNTTVHNEATASAVFPYPTTGGLDLAVINAGAAKQGTIRVYFRR